MEPISFIILTIFIIALLAASAYLMYLMFKGYGDFGAGFAQTFVSAIGLIIVSFVTAILFIVLLSFSLNYSWWIGFLGGIAVVLLNVLGVSITIAIFQLTK